MDGCCIRRRSQKEESMGEDATRSGGMDGDRNLERLGEERERETRSRIAADDIGEERKSMGRTALASLRWRGRKVMKKASCATIHSLS